MSYRPLPVRKGTNEKLPESRDAIRQKIIDKVKEKGVFRQEYSNGEFISSSLICGQTFEQVADRKLDLECGGYIAHYDEVLDIWWRTGGSFD